MYDVLDILPDCSHMMAGMCAWFLVSRRITDNSYMTCLCSNHFTYTTSSITDYNNRWRFIRFGTILKKWRKLRFRHFFLITKWLFYWILDDRSLSRARASPQFILFYLSLLLFVSIRFRLQCFNVFFFRRFQYFNFSRIRWWFFFFFR